MIAAHSFSHHQSSITDGLNGFSFACRKLTSCLTQSRTGVGGGGYCPRRLVIVMVMVTLFIHGKSFSKYHKEIKDNI